MRNINAKKLWQKGKEWLQTLLSPTSRKEDDARRERILLVILAFISTLSILFTLSVISLALWLQTTRHGISVLLVSIVTALFCTNIVLVKKGYWKIARVIFIILLILPTFYSLAHWGTLLPIPLLTLGLIILITGILFDVRSGVIIAGIIGLYLGLITYAHQHALLSVDSSWLFAPLYPNYTFEIMLILLVITGLTALAFSEIETNAVRARRSESQLSKELEKLKERIAEHTEALYASEQLRVQELSRFAEIGKVSAGLLHDLINPFTALSLAINHLHENVDSKSLHTESILQAVKATERLEKNIKHIKLQLGQGTARENISITKAIQQAVDTVRYAANQAGVKIAFEQTGQAYAHCTPARLHRALVNILINGIEALNKVSREKPLITIIFTKDKNIANITIIDNGPGLTRKELRQIFTPFYSTKPIGNGLGLSTAQDILNHELHATLTARSRVGKGTTFFISWESL
ncbi:MAG: HAMP domain-containing histidine kinase [Candidatus Magasanikbacteria bacterium]|nr:HAMP domain-containing histidine kinase [Candidatus Magasanikbacteria bacterium]